MARLALVLLLSCCGTVAGQQRQQVFPIKEALAALEDKTGVVPGDVQPITRFQRLVDAVLKKEAQAGARPQATRTLVRVGGRGGDQMLMVQGDKEVVDLVQSLIDQMQGQSLPRLHVMCTVLVMPVELARKHGLVANRAQETDMVAITALMKDVVKAKGVLLNLPEVLATPFVPFVAEPRAGGDKPPPPTAANLRLRGEAVAVGPEEALFAVQFVRGALPEDRTMLPKRSLGDQAFRLRVGPGVTMMAQDRTTATVMWLRFAGTSNAGPNEPPKLGKPVVIR
ncbi:MAG TPA: hypothetical protein VFD82_09150 [Planctomycetota bacterium]|nr:hypothetical protein [Planctomycetota bacterium]